MMKKHKTKIVAVIVVLAALIGAWFMGSAHLGGGEDALALVQEAPLPQETNIADHNLFASSELPLGFDHVVNTGNTAPNAEPPESEAPAENTTPGNSNSNPTPPPGQESESAPSAPTPTPNPTAPPTPTPSPPPAQTLPPETTFYVTLSVRVDTILRNMDLLDRAKHELIPANGVIFPATRVRVEQGESVFDVLQREMRLAGIHMSSRFTPAFNSAYVMAIHNISEFDVGPLSGWMYRVNGTFPNFGSSQYTLRPDDVIEWLYTVDLGRDIGGGAAFG